MSKQSEVLYHLHRRFRKYTTRKNTDHTHSTSQQKQQVIGFIMSCCNDSAFSDRSPLCMKHAQRLHKLPSIPPNWMFLQHECKLVPRLQTRTLASCLSVSDESTRSPLLCCLLATVPHDGASSDDSQRWVHVLVRWSPFQTWSWQVIDILYYNRLYDGIKCVSDMDRNKTKLKITRNIQGPLQALIQAGIRKRRGQRSQVSTG